MGLLYLYIYKYVYIYICLSQWPLVLRHGSTAARLQRLWVRMPPEAWMFVCCECCVLSGRGLCDGLITRPEESFRLCCVVVCDLESSRMRRAWPALGRSTTGKKKYIVKQSNKIKGLDRPWWYQEVGAPRFHDTHHMKVVRSALRTGRLYHQEILWPEGLCQWIITMTPSGIESANFLLVALFNTHTHRP